MPMALLKVSNGEKAFIKVKIENTFLSIKRCRFIQSFNLHGQF